MFIFEDVTKTFKTDFWKKPEVVLDNLSFKVGEGMCTGFLGANGAGKTTSLKILFRFINADKGRIEFDKSLGNNWDQIKRNVGFLPERPYFYPELTGSEFIKYMLSLSGLKKENIEAQYKYYSEYLLIDHALSKKLSTYSKGMLQRIGLLSCLLHNPRLIILDEPLSGLDPNGRKDIKNLMNSLKREGKTIFFSSHIVQDIEEVCREVVVIDHGKLKYNGEIDGIIDSQNSENKYEVRFSEVILDTPEWLKETSDTYCYELDQRDHDQLLKWAHEKKVKIDRFSKVRPTLEEIIYSGNYA
ncbi:ABC transporter ATP-binding protein [Bacteriovoracaceae bacterium]|nr:ABC transporter ATP-binding protein [Bacteriovoracaceae bacterium]|tara:strand:+ start:235377 stop:236276 length:900 start_codon:yes stop_codon:yes gene_type:complete